MSYATDLLSVRRGECLTEIDRLKGIAGKGSVDDRRDLLDECKDLEYTINLVEAIKYFSGQLK